MTSELHYHIRPARGDTELSCAKTLFQAYADSLEIDLSYQDFATELSRLPGDYAPPGGELLIAYNTDGQAIGCVALRPTTQTGYCEMKRLYVDPSARGSGLGKQLLEAIIQVANESGYHHICLDSLSSMKRAITLYEEIGFIPTDPYYDTPIAGTVFLHKQLSNAS